MAEFTGFRNNALPYPVYGLPYVIAVPLLDADGDGVSPSSPDSEISKNGDTAVDCTNELVEISGITGGCYLSLTGTELTCDMAYIECNSTGAKSTHFTLYPRKLVTIRTGTSASGGVSTSTIVLDASASAVDDFYNGMIVSAVIDSVTEVRMITDYTGSTQTASVVPDWNTAPDNNDTFTVLLPEGVQIQQANTTHLNSTAQTARDIGASVLLSSGTGTGQLKLASGYVAMTWADVAAPTTTQNLSGTTIATTQKVDVETIKTNPVVNGGTITFPTAATLASTTNITAGTVTTATNVTTVNGLAAGAITAASIASDAITAAKIADGAIDSATFAAGAITATVIADGAIDANTFASGALDAVWSVSVRVLTAATNITSTGGTTVPQTGDSFARIGAAGASLTDLGGMSTTMKAQVQTEAEDALVAHRLDELLNADSDIDGAAPPTVGSVFHELMSKTAGSFTFDQTTDALEALRDRGDSSWTTATGFSTHSAADVWASATRTLSAFAFSVTVGTNNDKTGYSLTQSFPANFADLAVTVTTGRVTVGTNADKTGYSLATAPPTAAENATAWGARVIGNARTADMYLQGLTNKIDFAADGLSWTLYGTDDATPLATGSATRLGDSIGGLRGADPA